LCIGRQPDEEPSEIEALHRVAPLFLVNVEKGFAHRAAVRCRASGMSSAIAIVFLRTTRMLSASCLDEFVTDAAGAAGDQNWYCS